MPDVTLDEYKLLMEEVEKDEATRAMQRKFSVPPEGWGVYECVSIAKGKDKEGTIHYVIKWSYFHPEAKDFLTWTQSLPMSNSQPLLSYGNDKTSQRITMENLAQINRAMKWPSEEEAFNAYKFPHKKWPTNKIGILIKHSTGKQPREDGSKMLFANARAYKPADQIEQTIDRSREPVAVADDIL